MTKLPIWLSIVMASLSVCACAPPAVLQGEFTAITPRQASAAPDAGAGGEQVRWGGMILSMTNAAERTCFEVLGQALDVQARPKAGDSDNGRFLACTPDYLDPETYRPGREITTVGRLSGTEVRRIGDYEYPYPRIEAQTVYLWPEREDPVYQYVYDPFPYPYAYYYPAPYYVYPVVYVVPRQAPEPPPPEAVTAESLARHNAKLARPVGITHAGIAPAASVRGLLSGGLRR